MHDSFLPSVLAAVAGAAIWTATMILAGGREPWDTGLYWTAAYPLAVTVSAVLGYLSPRKPWRWAVILMLMQLLVMFAAGSDLSLLPLGLAVPAVLSAPPALAGVLAAKLRT